MITTLPPSRAPLLSPLLQSQIDHIVRCNGSSLPLESTSTINAVDPITGQVAAAGTRRLTIRLPPRPVINAEWRQHARQALATQCPSASSPAPATGAPTGGSGGTVGTPTSGTDYGGSMSAVVAVLVDSSAADQTITRINRCVVVGLRNGRCHRPSAPRYVHMNAVGSPLARCRYLNESHIGGGGGLARAHSSDDPCDNATSSTLATAATATGKRVFGLQFVQTLQTALTQVNPTIAQTVSVGVAVDQIQAVQPPAPPFAADVHQILTVVGLSATGLIGFAAILVGLSMCYCRQWGCGKRKVIKPRGELLALWCNIAGVFLHLLTIHHLSPTMPTLRLQPIPTLTTPSHGSGRPPWRALPMQRHPKPRLPTLPSELPKTFWCHNAFWCCRLVVRWLSCQPLQLQLRRLHRQLQLQTVFKPSDRNVPCTGLIAPSIPEPHASLRGPPLSTTQVHPQLCQRRFVLPRKPLAPLLPLHGCCPLRLLASGPSRAPRGLLT